MAHRHDEASALPCRARPTRHAAAAVLAATAMLCVPAAINRQAMLYPDTPTYIRGAEMGAARLLGHARPWTAPAASAAPGDSGAPAAAPERNLKPLTSIEDKVVLAGRSVYYGAMLYAAYAAGSLWWAVLAQALCAAYVLHLVLVRLGRQGPRQFLAIAAGLAVLTPLGSFAGFLMPDVYAGLTILCSALLLAGWDRLPARHRWGVALLLLFSVSTHASHLALAALLFAGALALALLRTRAAPAWPGLLVLAGCVAGGLAGEWAFDKAVTRAVGAPPLRLPHPMGHLIAMGPGTAFLQARCPGAGYAACAYARNFPTAVDDFLFSTDSGKGAFALADAATKRRMSQEQFAFVLDVLRFDPVGVARGLALDALRQLAMFRTELWDYGRGGIERFYAGRVPQDVYRGMQQSVAARHLPVDPVLTALTYAGVLLSVLVLVHAGVPQRADAQLFGAVVLAGVVGNALVCGLGAYPLDRFQARVAWLLPLLAVLAVRARSPRASPRAAPPAADPTPTSWSLE